MARRLTAGIVTAALAATTAAYADPAPAPPQRPADLGRLRVERALAGARHSGVHPQIVQVLERALKADDDQMDATLVPWNDLDGDGLDDVLDFRVTAIVDGAGDVRFDVEVEARRGVDGDHLFTLALPEGDFGWVLPAKVGVAATEGLITVVYSSTTHYTTVGGGGAERLDVTGYDGDGDLVWTHAHVGGGMDTPAGTDYVLALVAGAGDLVAGAATDLLLEVDDITQLPDGTLVNALQPQLLDGATGVVTNSGAPAASAEGFVYLRSIPDVSRDRLTDLLLSETVGTGTRFTTRRSSDGMVVWSMDHDSYEGYPMTVGDIDGDSLGDLVLLSTDFEFEPDYASTVASRSEYLLDLIAGATGKVVWSRTGDGVQPLGDIDRRAGSELLVVHRNLAGAVGFKAEAVDARNRVLWRVTRAIDVRRYSRWEGYADADTVGDVQSDGVSDVRFAVVVMPYGARGSRDEGWIDGRTGAVHRDPAKNLIPLGEAVDGRGIDTATVTFGRSMLSVSVRDGRSGALLWSSAVAVAGKGAGRVFAGRLTGDRCADLLVTVYGGTITSIVYDGASGAPMWSLARSAGADPELGRPKPRSRVDRNSCR